MAKLWGLVITGAAVIAMSGLARAADLLPPPPALEPAPPTVAAPEFNGWYLRSDVGVAASANAPDLRVTPDPLIGAPAGAFNDFYNSTLSASEYFDFGAGYQFNSWLRADVTGEYRGGGHLQGLEQVGIPSQKYQLADFYRASTSSIIGLVNGYADIGTWYGVTPYVGAGMGFARNNVSGLTDSGFVYRNGVSAGSTGGYFSNGKSYNFAWALMAGFGFDITQNLKLEAGYRYLNYGKVKSGDSHCFSGTPANGGFSTASCGGAPYQLSSSNRLASNDFHIGLRYMLGEAPVYAAPQGPIVRKY